MSKRILLFPGQGSQYVGMGKEIAAAYEPARRLLEKADEVLGFSLSRIMQEGPEDDLKATQNTQPALFVVSMMVQELLKEKGTAFDFVAGHSLGEYSALCAAGALGFEDGLQLVRLRGELMAQAGEKRPGAMAAILGLERAKLEDVLTASAVAGTVVAANFNTPSQIVISGEVTAVQHAMAQCEAAGAKKVVALPVSGAFHSPLMEFAVEGLQVRLDQMELKTPSVPVITNVEATACQAPVKLKSLLLLQLTAPVRWTESIEAAVRLGCTEAYEVGAGKVLMGLARGISRELKVTPIEAPGQLPV